MNQRRSPHCGPGSAQSRLFIGGFSGGYKNVHLFKVCVFCYLAIVAVFAACSEPVSEVIPCLIEKIQGKIDKFTMIEPNVGSQSLVVSNFHSGQTHPY